MEKASKVMYKIANVFNWVVVVLGIAGIVFSILGLTGVLSGPEFAAFNGIFVGTLIFFIWILVFSVILIITTRVAYKKGSGRGWDVIFLILGIIDVNLFYFLGGLFGILSKE